jgi:acetyl esterase
MSEDTIDPRLDVRIQRLRRTKLMREQRALLGGTVEPEPATREELITYLNSPAISEQRKAVAEIMDFLGKDESKAPSKGLKFRKEAIPSTPDGNMINLQIIQPDTADRVPCVFYIHGGGMMHFSCFDGNYLAWGKIMAAKGLVVVMVDFRNSIVPSSVPEVGPFPAGLNDCVSGLKWTHASASALNISRIIVAGDSGGGNLAIATAIKLRRDGIADILHGVYAMCPMVSGEYPNPRFPSSSKSDGVTTTTEDLRRNALAYGLEHLAARDPLAWPIFASPADLTGPSPPAVPRYTQLALMPYKA